MPLPTLPDVDDVREAAGRLRGQVVPTPLLSSPQIDAQLGACVLVLILIITRPHDVVSYARVHQAFMLEAGAIAALSLAVSTAVLMSVRR